MSHINFSIACLCGLFAFHLASVGPAYSQQNQDTSALEAVVRSQICPGDKAPYAEISYREYGCRTICAKPELNGTYACGGETQIGYEFQCQREVDEKNRTIKAYNQFVRSCSQKRSEGADKTKPADKSSPWARRAEEMKAKAAGAEQINKDNAKSANDQAKQAAEKTDPEGYLRREREQLQEELRRQQERKDQIAREEATRRRPTFIDGYECYHERDICIEKCSLRGYGSSCGSVACNRAYHPRNWFCFR